MIDRLSKIAITPLGALRIDTEKSSVVLPLGRRTVSDSFPTLRLMPTSVVHLGPWRFGTGGQADEDPDGEWGQHRGYQTIDFDDSEWVACARINEVPLGFPTWEGNSYEGYAWYRTTFETVNEAGVAATLLLGSPLDARAIAWSVFLDGELITENTPVGADLALPVSADHLNPGLHVLAVRLRLVPADVTGQRAQEREGWRNVDPYCHQCVVFDPGFPLIDFSQVELTGSTARLRDAGGEWLLEMTYQAYHDGVIKTTELTRLGSDAATVSDIVIAGLTTGTDSFTVHPEGHWAGSRDLLVAGIDPAAVMISSASVS